MMDQVPTREQFQELLDDHADASSIGAIPRVRLLRRKIVAVYDLLTGRVPKPDTAQERAS